MIRCPKCSFEQPPDQYCARCGVNMATFKPPPIPWSRKITGSGGFYMFLLVSLIIASAYLIFNRSSKSELEIAEINPTRYQPVPTPTQPSTLNIKPTSSTQKIPSEEALAQQFRAAAENLFKEVEPKNLPTTTTSLESLRAAKSHSKPKLIAHFLEVPQSAIGVLFAGSSGSSMGIITSFSNRLKEAQRQSEGRLKVLTVLEKNIETPHTQIRFDQILNETIGIYIRALPNLINENQNNIDIHIEYRNQSLQGTPIIQDFDGSFVLPNAAAAYFADIFPRNPTIRIEDAELYSHNPVFKILTTPTYLTNSTEFLIFFEFKE